MELTLSIIKPDAVKKGLIGKIIDKLIEAEFQIVAMKLLHLTKPQAEGFYAVHRERPFFNDLTDFMSSGPCVVMVLQGKDIINRYRKLMGATNPEEAELGTIRIQAVNETIVGASDHSSISADRWAGFDPVTGLELPVQGTVRCNGVKVVVVATEIHRIINQGRRTADSRRHGEVPF